MFSVFTPLLLDIMVDGIRSRFSTKRRGVKWVAYHMEEIASSIKGMQ